MKLTRPVIPVKKGRDRIKPVRIPKGKPDVKARISRKMTTFGFGKH